MPRGRCLTGRAHATKHALHATPTTGDAPQPWRCLTHGHQILHSAESSLGTQRKLPADGGSADHVGGTGRVRPDTRLSPSVTLTIGLGCAVVGRPAGSWRMTVPGPCGLAWCDDREHGLRCRIGRRCRWCRWCWCGRYRFPSQAVGAARRVISRDRGIGLAGQETQTYTLTLSPTAPGTYTLQGWTTQPSTGRGFGASVTVTVTS